MTFDFCSVICLSLLQSDFSREVLVVLIWAVISRYSTKTIAESIQFYETKRCAAKFFRDFEHDILANCPCRFMARPR